MIHYSLPIKVVKAMKQPWFGWKMDILWCQLIKVSQYYLLFWTCLLHLIQLTIIYLSLGWKTYWVKVDKWFRSHLKQCSQRVFVHGIWHSVFVIWFSTRVPFWVFWFKKCMPILLESLRSDMALNITSMLTTQNCINLWTLTISEISLLPWNDIVWNP